MLAVTHTTTTVGIQGRLITVEVDVSNGLPGLTVVGLPDTCLRESRERIRSAVRNAGYDYPAQRMTVNLAPADLPKRGTEFDLAIAVGLLAATGQVPTGAIHGLAFLGELALDGTLRPVAGILPMIADLAGSGCQRLILPAANAADAESIGGIECLVANDLRQVVAFLRSARGLDRIEPLPSPASVTPRVALDLSQIRGQLVARRALEVAAAGGHNLLLVGPPGSGKSSLARCLPGILPPLDPAERLEVSRIHSVAGSLSGERGLLHHRPFRAPHHTLSDVALIGGGRPIRPGEISLAHRGVLFLDELPEIRRSTLEALRQPMEEGRVTVARASQVHVYPCEFQLMAAMNPCLCGHRGDEDRECLCTPPQIERYTTRLSGPLLDRIDLHVEVPRLPVETWFGAEDSARGESSTAVRSRVEAARAIQAERFAGRSSTVNARMTIQDLDDFCPLGSAERSFALQLLEGSDLTARGHKKLLAVARTIADLAGSERLLKGHLGEAAALRRALAMSRA